MSADYDGTVEQVHGAFCDRQYWLARLADSGADDATLDALDVAPDGGVSVATTQVLRRENLPGLINQFHKGDLRIVRRETWSPLRDGTATARVSGDVANAPVSLAGDGTLTGKGAGSALSFHGNVEVRVPLVGGKIESFIAAQLVELLSAEQRFTTAWLQQI